MQKSEKGAERCSKGARRTSAASAPRVLLTVCSLIAISSAAPSTVCTSLARSPADVHFKCCVVFVTDCSGSAPAWARSPAGRNHVRDGMCANVCKLRYIVR